MTIPRGTPTRVCFWVHTQTHSQSTHVQFLSRFWTFLQVGKIRQSVISVLFARSGNLLLPDGLWCTCILETEC